MRPAALPLPNTARPAYPRPPQPRPAPAGPPRFAPPRPHPPRQRLLVLHEQALVRDVELGLLEDGAVAVHAAGHHELQGAGRGGGPAGGRAGFSLCDGRLHALYGAPSPACCRQAPALPAAAHQQLCGRHYPTYHWATSFQPFPTALRRDKLPLPCGFFCPAVFQTPCAPGWPHPRAWQGPCTAWPHQSSATRAGRGRAGGRGGEKGGMFGTARVLAFGTLSLFRAVLRYFAVPLRQQSRWLALGAGRALRRWAAGPPACGCRLRPPVRQAPAGCRCQARRRP